MARIVDEMKFKLPLRNDSSGQFFNNAASNLNRSDVRPDVTSSRLREVKDDIAIILDRDMSGLGHKKTTERSLARVKKDEMSSGSKNVTILNSSTAPSSALIKIKLTGDDRFIGHEVTKSHPMDDIRVTIDKQQTAPPIVYQMPTNFTSLRTISPSPPPTIIRSEVRHATPPPVACPHPDSNRARASSHQSGQAQDPDEVEDCHWTVDAGGVQDHCPPRRACQGRTGDTAQLHSRLFDEVVGGPISKPKEALTVISEPPPPEPVKVPKQLDDRRRNVFYNEQRNPYFLNPETKATFLGGTEIKAYDAGDCNIP